MLREVAAEVWSRFGRLPFIDADDLAHDCFLRIARQRRFERFTRTAQRAYCTTVIRRLMVDELKQRAKQRLVSQSSAVLSTIPEKDEPPVDLEPLSQVLDALAKTAPRQARLVELRFFEGLPQQEIAQRVNASERTLRREWALTRSWLLDHIQGSVAV